MAHTLRPLKQISYDENVLDSFDYTKDVKQEPTDTPEEHDSYGVKNEYVDYQNETDFSANDPYPTSISTWELLVKRCRFLIQEEQEYNQMNSHSTFHMLVMVYFQKIVSVSKQLKCLRCRMAGMDP